MYYFMSIVGLPEADVKESKDRIRSALINAPFEFPTQRITMQWKINRNIIYR
jgi:magnesium chelatase family protein